MCGYDKFFAGHINYVEDQWWLYLIISCAIGGILVTIIFTLVLCRCKRSDGSKLDSNVNDIQMIKMAAEEGDVTMPIQESLAFPKIL